MARESSTASLTVNCGLWSLIGAFLAVLASKHWNLGWWPVLPAALVFGFGSYLTENIREVGAGLHHAWCRTVAWRPDWLYWRLHFAGSFYLFIWMSTVAWAFFLLFFSLGLEPDNNRSYFVAVGIVPALLGMALGAFMVFVQLMHTCRGRVTIVHLSREVEFLRKTALIFNPIVLPIAILVLLVQSIYRIPKATGWTWRACRSAFATVRSFSWHLFVCIHSERRTICLLSTILGIATGFVCGLFYQSPPVGGLCGGATGVLYGFLHYQIVSVRWLKLQPA